MTHDVIRSKDRSSSGVTDGNRPGILGSRRREEGNTAEQYERREHHVVSCGDRREKRVGNDVGVLPPLYFIYKYL